MPRSHSRTWYAVVASAFFVAANVLSDMVRWFDLPRMPGYFWSTVQNLMMVMVVFIGVAVGHRIGLRRMARELGLSAPVGRGLLFALLASSPMLVAFAFTSPLSRNMTPLGVALLCFISPFAEELLFRAFLFRQLYRRSRLGFWPSALIPSVLFGLAHMSQSTDPAEIAGILAITGTGGLLFCWLLVKWDGNIWPAFGLHASMNLWWELFAVDNTALGGWLANAARAATVLLAILLTIYKDRIWKPVPAAGEWRCGDGVVEDERGPHLRRSTRISPSTPSTLILQPDSDR